MTIRRSLVAGQFYPVNEQALISEVKKYLAGGHAAPAERLVVRLAMVPHAGYIYSGALAGQVFSQAVIPEQVLLLGPNHSGRGAGVALAGYQAWQTPLGLVPQNQSLDALLLQECQLLTTDNRAHDQEHSLEVELPFLQVLRPNLSISAISLGRLAWPELRDLATGISQAITNLGHEVLIVASTDMSHYQSAPVGQALDELALQKVQDFDPAGLYETVRKHNISMCGVLAVALGLAVARQLGANQVRMVGYRHSGQVSGDHARVVGYAGALAW